MAEAFDIVIVGAGPAGCVLASRLSEDPYRRVLLLEAGPDYGSDQTGWPPELLDSSTVPTDSHPWGHNHVERSEAGPLGLPRGRVIGGTSTINGCIWLRGSADDYDRWAAAGNPGWEFAHLLPHFSRAERDLVGGVIHGTAGPVPVSRVAESALTPVDHLLIESANALGVPYVDDFNDQPQQRPGVGPTPKNIEGGSRMNAALTYLAAARERPNLTIRAGALVDRVVIEDGKAAGVVLTSGEVVSGEEFVVSSGAYGSPAILLRSGIGPAAELDALKIPVVRDLPGVGENLRDHPMVGFGNVKIAANQAPLGRTFMPVIIKGRSKQAADEIDFHIYQGQSFDDPAVGWTLWLSISLQDAHSTGTVRLSSPDPEAPLLIDHGYFTDEHDLEAMCDGLEFARQLVRTAPLGSAVSEDPALCSQWETRDELRALVKRTVGTTFHPSSTCKMGPASDPMAVVDHEGRVHGVRGLRVVDASIFPTGPRCNLHFPIVAAAEMIASNYEIGN